VTGKLARSKKNAAQTWSTGQGSLRADVATAAPPNPCATGMNMSC